MPHKKVSLVQIYLNENAGFRYVKRLNMFVRAVIIKPPRADFLDLRIRIDCIPYEALATARVPKSARTWEWWNNEAACQHIVDLIVRDLRGLDTAHSFVVDYDDRIVPQKE